MNTTLHFKCHTIIGCECELFEISMVSFIMDVQIYQCAILYSMSWYALNSNRFPAGDLMCPSNCIHNKYQNKSINQCALQWENFATFLSPHFIYLPLCLLLFLRPRAIAHSHTPQATSRLCARGRKKNVNKQIKLKCFGRARLEHLYVSKWFAGEVEYLSAMTIRALCVAFQWIWSFSVSFTFAVTAKTECTATDRAIHSKLIQLTSWFHLCLISFRFNGLNDYFIYGQNPLKWPWARER